MGFCVDFGPKCGPGRAESGADVAGGDTNFGLDRHWASLEVWSVEHMTKDRVLIAGAGPVGLAAAMDLAMQDIPVTVMEAEAALPENLRASTFHPPTLDMLAHLGATEKLMAEGLVAPKFQYRDRREGLIAEFDFTLLSDVYI
jgi:NADPH-dependent 2,4-dienoyl-CoA reductase/sulfur reductase-like enzyme